MKYEAGTAAFKTQTTYETVAAAQRCLVFHFYLPHNCIDSLIVHLYEGESRVHAELMSRVLHVMEIVGIIHYLLAVKLIIPYLHIHYETIFLFRIL